MWGTRMVAQLSLGLASGGGWILVRPDSGLPRFHARPFQDSFVWILIRLWLSFKAMAARGPGASNPSRLALIAS